MICSRPLRRLEVDLGAHDDASVARAVHVGDVRVSMIPPVGKSGPLTMRIRSSVALGIVDEAVHRVAHLAEVVRRDVGRHADGDAARAVDQQVRKQRRHHERLRTPGTLAKFGPKSTVSFSMSSTRLIATAVIRASVYR